MEAILSRHLYLFILPQLVFNVPRSKVDPHPEFVLYPLFSKKHFLGPVHTGRGAPCNTAVNWSFHKGCKQHQSIFTQNCTQINLRVLCERGPMDDSSCFRTCTLQLLELQTWMWTSLWSQFCLAEIYNSPRTMTTMIHHEPSIQCKIPQDDWHKRELSSGSRGGWGPGPPLPPRFLQNHAVFRQF